MLDEINLKKRFDPVQWSELARIFTFLGFLNNKYNRPEVIDCGTLSNSINNIIFYNDVDGINDKKINFYSDLIYISCHRNIFHGSSTFPTSLCELIKNFIGRSSGDCIDFESLRKEVDDCIGFLLLDDSVEFINGIHSAKFLNFVRKEEEKIENVCLFRRNSEVTALRNASILVARDEARRVSTMLQKFKHEASKKMSQPSFLLLSSKSSRNSKSNDFTKNKENDDNHLSLKSIKLENKLSFRSGSRSPQSMRSITADDIDGSKSLPSSSFSINKQPIDINRVIYRGKVLSSTELPIRVRSASNGDLPMETPQSNNRSRELIQNHASMILDQYRGLTLLAAPFLKKDKEITEDISLKMLDFIVSVFGLSVIGKNGFPSVNKVNLASKILFGHFNVCLNLKNRYDFDNFDIIYFKNVIDIDYFDGIFDIDQEYTFKLPKKHIHELFNGSKLEHYSKFVLDRVGNDSQPDKSRILTVKMLRDEAKERPIFYSRTASRGTLLETSMQCSLYDRFLPTSFRALKDAEKKEFDPLSPIGFWRADFVFVNGRQSHISLLATQMGTSEPSTKADDYLRAKSVIAELVKKSGALINKKSIQIIDIRLLTVFNIYGVKGSSNRSLYDHQLRVMKKALLDFNGRYDDYEIYYVPISVESHTTDGMIISNTVGIFDKERKLRENKILASSDELLALQKLINDEWSKLDNNKQCKYKSGFYKWNYLSNNLSKINNSFPFVALTLILVGLFNNNDKSENHIEVVMGCKSAKDRTGGVLAGVSMLLPLFHLEFERAKPDIDRYFTKDDRFNVDKAADAEMLHMLNAYDMKLLHATNRINLNASTNKAPNMMNASFFSSIPFLKKSNIFTMNIAG